jgi:hypothetical protein
MVDLQQPTHVHATMITNKLMCVDDYYAQLFLLYLSYNTNVDDYCAPLLLLDFSCNINIFSEIVACVLEEE